MLYRLRHLEKRLGLVSKPKLKVSVSKEKVSFTSLVSAVG